MDFPAFREPAIDLIRGDIPADPPPGFRAIPPGTGFNTLLGPLFGRVEGGALILGMRIGHRHINPHQTCHGGVLASFADMMVYCCQYEGGLEEALLPTISMSLDYISPAACGEWVEGRAQLLRKSKSLLFAQGIATVGDRIVFRSSCIYKVTGAQAPDGSKIGSVFEGGDR